MVSEARVATLTRETAEGRIFYDPFDTTVPTSPGVLDIARDAFIT